MIGYDATGPVGKGVVQTGFGVQYVESFLSNYSTVCLFETQKVNEPAHVGRFIHVHSGAQKFWNITRVLQRGN